jgi:hypothetical protein
MEVTVTLKKAYVRKMSYFNRLKTKGRESLKEFYCIREDRNTVVP